MGAPTLTLDERLKEWATPHQAAVIDAINEHGSIRAAARALGRGYTSVYQSLDLLKKKAALFGYSPEHGMTRTVPDGYRVRGVSTLYDGNGKTCAQWVKSAADEGRQAELFKQAFEAMAQELPRLAPVSPPDLTARHLCNLYTLTDCHVGMKAWGKETGADWDLEIAERVLTGAFSQMVNATPRASVAVVNQLGDWLHQDTVAPLTPTSGHLLDADGRFAKVVQVAIRILRLVIAMALERHDRVIVLLAQGNHDISSSIWLRTMFRALYENEPRIEVIDSELPYYAVQHGKVMLAFHHGHKRKQEELPLLFAAQFPQMWGATTKRYAHMGHMHHVNEKEFSGMLVTQHATLAARDSYAAQGGWISERQATAITYHAEYGQVGRVTVTPEMLS